MGLGPLDVLRSILTRPTRDYLSVGKVRGIGIISSPREGMLMWSVQVNSPDQALGNESRRNVSLKGQAFW